MDLHEIRRGKPENVGQSLEVTQNIYYVEKLLTVYIVLYDYNLLNGNSWNIY